MEVGGTEVPEGHGRGQDISQVNYKNNESQEESTRSHGAKGRRQEPESNTIGSHRVMSSLMSPTKSHGSFREGDNQNGQNKRSLGHTYCTSLSKMFSKLTVRNENDKGMTNFQCLLGFDPLCDKTRDIAIQLGLFYVRDDKLTVETSGVDNVTSQIRKTRPMPVS